MILMSFDVFIFFENGGGVRAVHKRRGGVRRVAISNLRLKNIFQNHFQKSDDGRRYDGHFGGWRPPPYVV